MRKKPTIRMKSKETAAEAFELFLLTKRADGVKPRTIETYKQHFHAISKHLNTEHKALFLYHILLMGTFL